MKAGRGRDSARAWRDEAAIAVVLAALAFALAIGSWTWRADRLLYDTALAFWRQPAPADVAIVAIDDASIAAIGRWPWPRSVHATLLERLAAAKPKALLLDIMLSEADPEPRQDELLASALARAAPVALPVAWQRGRDGLVSALEPHGALREAARLGTAEASVDPDGVLRHGYLQAGPAGAARRYPHLALALLEAGGERAAPGLALQHAPPPAQQPAPATGDVVGDAWQRDGQLLIRYVGPPGSFERLSYVDVLSGRVAAERLRGRYLLIGMTAQGLGDTLATPVNASAQAMPGVEVLANLLQTLRRGNAPSEPSPLSLALASALAVAGLVFALGTVGQRLALPLALTAVPAALLASFVGVRAGLFVSAVPFVLAATLAYPLWSWRRLERAMGGLDDQLRQLAARPLLRHPATADGPTDPIAERLALLREAVAAVQGTERFLAETLEGLPNAMLVAGAKGQVLLANAQAAELFDVEEAEELADLDLARLLGEFQPREEAIDWAALVAVQLGGAGGTAVTGGASAASRVIEAALAGHGDYVIHLSPAWLREQPCLVVAIADVRPLKDAERQREEALAFVSHDLRSPAQGIVMLGQLQQRGALPQGTDFAAEVQRLAARTLALSEEFVRAAQAQTQPLRCTQAAVAELLREAVAEQQAAALAAGVELTVSVVPGDASISVDRLLVERAVANLVGNAVKFSPAGTRVEIDARRDGMTLTIAVGDRGPGLSEAQRAQLAGGQRGAAAGDLRGVGLGLQFVQRVATRHGGRLVALQRSPGPGAGMVLELADTPSGNP